MHSRNELLSILNRKLVSVKRISKVTQSIFQVSLSALVRDTLEEKRMVWRNPRKVEGCGGLFENDLLVVLIFDKLKLWKGMMHW